MTSDETSPSWASGLADGLRLRLLEQHPTHQYIEAVAFVQVSGEELVVRFKIRGLSDLRAVRLERNIIETNGLLGYGRPIHEVAPLVAILALEEPHSLKEYDRDESGVYWLRASEWLP